MLFLLPRAHRSLRSRTFLLLAALTAVTLGLGMVAVPAQPAAAAPVELVKNWDFSSGSTGWRTNSPEQKLTIVGDSPAVARLTTTRGGNAVLNDVAKTVEQVAPGTAFTVGARVRTTTPGVNGSLRVREVASSGVTTHKTDFTLSDTTWRSVTLQFTSSRQGAGMDLNLMARSLTATQNLEVQWVSMKAAVAPPTQQGCVKHVPTSTQIGVSISRVDRSLADALKYVDATYGKVPVVRHFSAGLPPAWGSEQANLLRGRSLVMSFKVPPAQVTNGSHDAFFRSWFANAPTDQLVYWSYQHEPENNINSGEFTAAQYRAAWAHLARLSRQTCKPNMLSTLILTEWTMNPQSKRDYTVYDAGKQHVDVLAFDPYNGIYDRDRDYYAAPADLLGNIVTTMRADGRPWGIAEVGSRIVVGDNGTGRAAWLTATATYSRTKGALFVTYFDSVGREGDFRLLDRASQTSWATQVTTK